MHGELGMKADHAKRFNGGEGMGRGRLKSVVQILVIRPYGLYTSARSIAPQQTIRLTNLFVRLHSERRGRLGVTVQVTAGSVTSSLRPLTVTVTISSSPASATFRTCGKDDDTDNGVSIPLSSAAVAAGGIDVAADESAQYGDSVDKGNSADAMNSTPISRASPEGLARTAILENDKNVSCTGKLWESLLFGLFSWRLSISGTIKTGADFQRVNGALA